MTDPPVDPTLDLFKKKAAKKKKKKLGFNASAESDDLETDDIVHRIVNQLSTTALMSAVADCVGCTRRRSALTILRDLAFALGEDDEQLWPNDESSIAAILDFLHLIRDDITIEPKVTEMVACWRELGALWPIENGSQKKKKKKKFRYEWDLGQVKKILSSVTFLNNQEEARGLSLPDDSPQRDCNLPECFIRKIPMIVEAVAFAGKDRGMSTSEIMREGQLRVVSENPGPMLRAIPELTCRKQKGKQRYFLANEDGYREPSLAAIMSQGGGGAEALQVLLMLTNLCVEQLPRNTPEMNFALRFCDCKTEEQQRVALDCWKRLGLLNCPESWIGIKIAFRACCLALLWRAIWTKKLQSISSYAISPSFLPID